MFLSRRQFVAKNPRPHPIEKNSLDKIKEVYSWIITDRPRAIEFWNGYLQLVEFGRSFLFREALLGRSKSRSAAQRTLDTTTRMASRTEELFVLPPPVGAGINSRSVKGARPWNFSRTIQYE